MIQIQSIVLLPGGIWRYTWNTTGADFYRIVLDGRTIATVVGTSYDYLRGGTYPPPLEITDGLADSEKYQSYLTIQWYPAPGASSYTVQRYNSTWSDIISMLESGSPLYQYTTLLLDDVSTYRFRILSYNSIGQVSQEVSHTIYVVRPPTLVETSYKVTYGTGLIIFEVKP